MIYCGESLYFDIEEIEEIVEYFVNKHDFVKALEVIEYGLHFHTSSSELILRKADLLAAMGKYRDALTLINRLEKIEANNVDLLLIKGSIYSQMGKPEKAIPYLLKAAENTDEHLDEIYLDIAEEYNEIDDIDNAIKFYGLAIKFNPENNHAIYEIAYLFEESDKIVDAINFFNQLINEEPYCELAWFYLGTFRGFDRDYNGAIEAYDFALAINEKYVQAHYEKGHAYSLIADDDKAIDCFSEVINLDPTHYNAYFYLARAYDNLNNESKALASYSKAVKINKNLDVAWLEMALMLERNNKYIDAVYHIKKATEINDKNPENWFVFARIHQQLGLLEEAKYAFDKAVEINPTEVDFWMEYSDMLFVNEYFNESIETIDTAIENIPDAAELYYKKAAFFLSVGMNSEAEIILEYALGLDFSKHKKLFEYLPQSKNNIFVAELISSYNK